MLKASVPEFWFEIAVLDYVVELLLPPKDGHNFKGVF